MDIIDQASNAESLFLSSALANATATDTGPGPDWVGDTAYCRECGDEIPKARLEAVPGCGLCVECAE